MTGAGVYVDGGPNTLLVAAMGYANSRRVLFIRLKMTGMGVSGC